MALRPRRQPSSYSTPWELQILLDYFYTSLYPSVRQISLAEAPVTPWLTTPNIKHANASCSETRRNRCAKTTAGCELKDGVSTWFEADGVEQGGLIRGDDSITADKSGTSSHFLTGERNISATCTAVTPSMYSKIFCWIYFNSYEGNNQRVRYKKVKTWEEVKNTWVQNLLSGPCVYHMLLKTAVTKIIMIIIIKKTWPCIR
jgi:hypothetical protein